MFTTIFTLPYSKNSQKMWVSLKTKLIISLLTIILCTLIISTILVVKKTDTVINYVKTQHLEESALSLRNRISAELQRAGKDIVLMAALPKIFQGIELSPMNDPLLKDENERIGLITLLNRARLAYNYYNALWIVNGQGQYLAGSLNNPQANYNISDPKELESILSKNTLVIANAIEDSISKDILLPIYLKIIYNGKKGIFAGELQINKMARNALYELQRPLINAYIMNSQGKIVGSTNTKKAKNTELDMPAFKAISGTMFININNDKKDMAYHHIPRTDLYAVIIADSTYMDNYIEDIKLSILFIVAISAILLLVSLYIFISPLINDIKSLSLFTKKIIQNEPMHALNIHRNDELGDLAFSITKMVSVLTEMLEQTKAVTKAKGAFLAQMSHEIRTPMNAIIGMTYLALQDNPKKEQKHFLLRIDKAANNLLGIINDILDFSKLDAAKMEIDYRPFNLRDMLISTQELLEVKSLEKNLKLTYSMDKNVPDIIEGDQLRLSQICINLVSNAIKFTEKGNVELHVSIKERRSTSLVLLFSIKDSGIGIDFESQKRIFDSFSQVDNSATRQYEGTGLGLAISKSLVKIMGGEIWIKSVLNKGSTFYFTIQTNIVSQIAAEPEQGIKDNVEHPKLENIHILLVEDNLVNQEIAVAILKNMEAKVTVANNGAEALEFWNDSDNEFNIILMDIQMPIMDGLTATKHIREISNKKSKNVPIIALTANAMSGDKEKSLQVGMNDHVTKPLNIDNLYATLTYWASVCKMK